MKPSEFNASIAGQRAMCADASSRAVAFNLNSFVRRNGGSPWDDAMIASANESTLAAIKEDLINEYNACCKRLQSK